LIPGFAALLTLHSHNAGLTGHIKRRRKQGFSNIWRKISYL